MEDRRKHLEALNKKIEELESAQEHGDNTRLTMLRLNSLRVLRYKLERGV